MKNFVYWVLLFGVVSGFFGVDTARAAISPADKVLKNIGSNGKETVGQYLQRNKDIIPKALMERWTKDPAYKSLPMLPIEVSNSQGKLIFYLKDSSKKQHTMIWRAERNNLFTFDGTAISAAQFFDQDSFIRNISGRDYRIRKMIEKRDPKMWTNAFRPLELPTTSMLKTQNKEKFVVYHRATVLFWLQARQVNQHKKSVVLQTEAKSFADFIFSAIFESAEAQARTRCIERGYVGYDEGSGCVIRGDEECKNGKRSCNQKIFGKTEKGLIKCGAASGGDEECGADIRTSSPLNGMNEQVFLQPNLNGIKSSLGPAEKLEADKFARSFLKTSGDLNFKELDDAYTVFKEEISAAYSLCQKEFEKEKATAPDTALRKKCLNLKKQEILFDVGLDLVKGNNSYTYVKDQAKTCDDSSLPTCDSPEATGKPTCYKGTLSCHSSGFMVGAGAVGVAALALADHSRKKGHSKTPEAPAWPPKDPCNVDGAPTFLCSDPEKCKSPYDFSTVFNSCKPPVCGAVGQVYSEIAKGCVDTCTNANQMMAKWKNENPQSNQSSLTMSPNYLEPLNCFNSSCVAPKIWNPWNSKCEDPVDCTQAPGLGLGFYPNKTPMVRDQFNQCTFTQCGYGTERDWYSGECVAYSNWQTCPGTGIKVAKLDQCNLLLVSPAASSTTTDGGGTR